MTAKARTTIEQKVAALGDLSYAELSAMWVKSHGFAPPKGAKRQLLQRSISFDLQVKAHGPLSRAARKELKSAMRAYAAKRQLGDDRTEMTLSGKEFNEPRCTWSESEINMGSDPHLQPAPRKSRLSRKAPQGVMLAAGTRLVRDWNGRRHCVDVGDKGFIFDGKTYRSLSAIARKITGAHWSGPRFFGL
jgi:hypothetical protein